MIPISKYVSRAVLKYPLLNIVLIISITLVFAFFAQRLKFDTSLSAFVIRDDPDMLYYNEIKETFETDETIVIAFKARELFHKKDLEIIKSLSDKIGELPYVRNVNSLTNANLVITTPGTFEVSSLVKKMPETEKESQAIERNATTNYLYTKDLTSLDGQFGALLVDIKNVTGEKHTKETVETISRFLLKESQRSGIKFYLAGDAIINHSLGEYMQRDFFAFLLPTYAVLIFLLIITVGRLRDITISLITITLSLLWAIGTISLLGKTLNNVTIGIIPLILCIALEDIYYIHSAYYSRLRDLRDKKRAFEEAISHVIKPCFFTSFTTVIGFGSLMVNNVKPILDFGIIGSACVMFAFIIALLLIPSIHLLLPMPIDLEKKFKFKINAARLLTKIGKFTLKRQRMFWWLISGILLFSIVGIFRIRVETDHLTFFHKNSEVYKATTFVENNLAGVSNLELTVRSVHAGGIKDPHNLRMMEKLSYFLRNTPKIDKALSIVDFLKDMNRAMFDNDEKHYTVPDTRGLVAQYLLLYSMSPRRNDIEKDFVDHPYRLGRIRCRTSEHNSTAILNMIKQIRAFVSLHFPPDLIVKITSYPVIYSNMVDSLARGQMKCLILVFFCLLIVTSIYFKSLKIGLLAMIPNIVPITFSLGIMGWAGISLNIATAMTVGIAIGLAMDDTTHFFTYFKDRFCEDADYVKNTQKTLCALGEPMIYSSLLMIAGYLILLSSKFHLTTLFGFLCALTIFVALLSDIFITTWIIITFKPKFKKE